MTPALDPAVSEATASGTTTAADRRSEPRTECRSAKHAHHYLVEPPNGATCLGRCKHCGDVRTYSTAGKDMHDAANAARLARAGAAGAAASKKKGGAKSKAQFGEFYRDLHHGGAP